MASILHSCSAVDGRSTSESESVGGSRESDPDILSASDATAYTLTYVLAQLVRTYT